MFKRILVANRGEIAVRVIRTARALGVETVAVYSDVDATALHVAEADSAVSIGAARPGESYLRPEAILDAAKVSGAEAIHPGYGFLSENPDFVDAVEAAGLVFIGPPAAAIRAMGLKDAAKRLMVEAGVPVVPGYHGRDQDPGRLEVEAAEIGYPVLIKAVAGGGGVGMRRVDGPAEFVSALEGAKADALGAFGNDAVLIEKFVATPRHIEVQIFGDGDRALHLFERDCSLQRRHQKVIEESPAPGMTAELRAAMGAAAVRAAVAIGYTGAGTVEFVVDASDGLRPDRFFFMEMNTRLQVEHPVTEAVTGIDLVEWQLRVAAGEPLPLQQDDMVLNGHAVEARLYAEDVPAGFLPATGHIGHLVFPEDVRIDTGVRAGDAVSPHYDPMIAKLIAHGPTREIAFAKLARGLARTEVAGLTTNLTFLRRLIAHPEVAGGRVDTGLIGRHHDDLTAAALPCSRTRALAAIGALGLDAPQPFEGFTLWAPLRHRARLCHHGQDFSAEVSVEGPGVFTVTLGETQHSVARTESGWRIDGRHVAARVVRHGAGLSVFWGNGYHFELPDPLDAGAEIESGAATILAPMPGLVTVVMVAPGAVVTEGAPILTLEAMKMQHTLRAPRDCVVAEVMVTEATQVDANAALIRLEEEVE
ncbi:MAG: biotin carboxylase N-terminal domain-containing protein [Pseudomonadota bacterium]